MVDHGQGECEIQTRPQRQNKPLRWTILLIDMIKVISFCCQNFQPILLGGVFSGKHLTFYTTKIT